MARPKSTSNLVFINQVYPRDVCNGMDTLTSMFLIPNVSLPDELGMVEDICEAWGIAAYWIAYDMFPIADISRPPTYTRIFSSTALGQKFFMHTKGCVMDAKKIGDQVAFTLLPSGDGLLAWKKLS